MKGGVLISYVVAVEVVICLGWPFSEDLLSLFLIFVYLVIFGFGASSGIWLLTLRSAIALGAWGAIGAAGDRTQVGPM